MTKHYSAYLIRSMSQVVEFDAADDATPEQLADTAVDLHSLDANISNDFEEDGEVEIYYIRDANGQEVPGRGESW